MYAAESEDFADILDGLLRVDTGFFCAHFRYLVEVFGVVVDVVDALAYRGDDLDDVFGELLLHIAVAYRAVVPSRLKMFKSMICM